MHRIENKCDAVKEIQDLLLSLSYKDPEIPQVPIDGVYGKNTKNAVMQFQKKHGLNVTGSVDYDTFRKLCDDCKAMDSSGYSLSYGDSGPEVEMLHILLSFKDNEKKRIRSTYFGKDTEDEVRRVQRCFDLEETGIADENLLRMLFYTMMAKETPQNP